MSRFQKNVDRILELAQRSEISEFVVDKQYILFKRKQLRKEQWKDIYSLIDATTGATGATAVAPKFSDTLTLSQPRGADSAHHRRGRS